MRMHASLCTYIVTSVCLQDESSFVSLRDVERAMIIFEWFYDKNEFFEKLMKQMSMYEVRAYNN